MSNFKVNKVVAFLFLGVFLILFPFVVGDYILHLGIMAIINILLAVSIGLVLGYLGELSFGHAIFYGIGAYFSAYVTMNYGWPFWISMPIAIIVTMIIGFFVAFISFRTKGHYFALVTMGIGQIFFILANNLEHVTGGGAGIRGIQPPESINLGFMQINFEVREVMYYFILLIAILAIWFVYQVIVSKYGRSFVAVREDQLLSEFVGLHSMRLKLTNFTLSAGVAGLAGVLSAHFILFVSPDFLSLTQSMNMLLMVILGGMGTIVGPIIGGVLLTVLMEVLNVVGEYKMIVYGAILIILILFLPKGIYGTLKHRKYNAVKMPSKNIKKPSENDELIKNSI